MSDWCPENDGAYRAELAHRAKVMRDRDALSAAMELPEVRALIDALEYFIAETVDYITFNKLGDPDQQHSVKLARAALAAIKEPKP